MIPDKPGVYPSLTFAEYHAIQAMNHSTLTTYSPTPAHAKAAALRPPPTSPEQDFGNLAHAAVLEPGRFARDYVSMPAWMAETPEGQGARAAFDEIRAARLGKGELKSGSMEPDRATVEGKALHAAFDSATVGKVRIGINEHVAIRGMLASVSSDAHSVARDLLYGDGTMELAILWLDEETGALCKARLDKLVVWQGFSVIVDLKSSNDASASGFSRTAAKFDYDSQAAFYGDGMRALGAIMPELKSDWRFLHVVIETSEPFEVAVYELDDQAIESGRQKYRRWLRQHGECLASGVWPGYANGPEPLALPRWAVDPAARLVE